MAIEISSPGTLVGLAIGLRAPLLDDDDEISTVSGSAKTIRGGTLTLSNVAKNAATVTTDDGETFAANRAITFDLAAGSGITATEGELRFNYTTADGESLWVKVPLKVSPYIEI